MPLYNYHCLDCEEKAFKQHADLCKTGLDGRQVLPADLYEELVLFETSHAMQPSAEELHEATECPRCKGHNCEKTLYGSQIIGYVRGYGFLDKAGAKRDMNRFKLTEEDPYAEYRVPGEVDDIKRKLDDGGRHAPKTQTFVPTKEMEAAVEKAVNKPASSNE